MKMVETTANNRLLAPSMNHSQHFRLKLWFHHSRCLQIGSGLEIVECRMPKDKASLPSRQWSCSELANSNKEMLEVKREGESRDDLEKRIKEPLVLYIFMCSSNPSNKLKINSQI